MLVYIFLQGNSLRIESVRIQGKSPYSVQMWENADCKNSEYGHISYRVCLVTVIF